MSNWLSNRLTPAKTKEDRWVELSTALEQAWEEFFDPCLSRLERLKSAYSADDADLIKKIREMGDYFSFDMPREENRPISLSWRRLELEYKDMELIIISIFRRHFNNLPVHWLPLYAPKDLPYGSLFEIASEFEISIKNIPPDGMFLTSRGMLGADYGYLMTMRLSKSDFLERALPLIRRAKPLHIVFDGMLWFARFDMPFEAEISDEYSRLERDWGIIDMPFSALGSRYDFIPADARPTDIQTLDCAWQRENAAIIPFCPENPWRIDSFLPEGMPEDWLPGDILFTGHEGANALASIAGKIQILEFSIAFISPIMAFEHQKTGDANE